MNKNESLANVEEVDDEEEEVFNEFNFNNIEDNIQEENYDNLF